MSGNIAEQEVSTLSVVTEVEIKAPVGVVFESVLAEMGPEGRMPDGKAFPMVLEAWPGGRWYRDLGNNAGHLWGHVQVIKPPTLLEVCGPMFMSYPAVSHVQYRLTETKGGTTLKITHHAMGMIVPEHREGVGEGWKFMAETVRAIAERRVRG